MTMPRQTEDERKNMPTNGLAAAGADVLRLLLMGGVLLALIYVCC